MDDFGIVGRIEVRPELGTGPLGCVQCALTLRVFELLAGPDTSAAPGTCPECGTPHSEVTAPVGVPARS
ncbi:hypothetical protein [Streptomyces sp. NBC_01237]|uniref:hypothetical protein n=1 Tax=Streptomyces sp. NBC_01237 TaxID=2903790 RepID=UPI002DDAF4CB|nr:hypothetical protein [Streptomyces sp. NBC_01237]WRZ77295.1 hypothetical protein OG251_37215 [Streptomyces sp. NBC_01237]